MRESKAIAFREFHLLAKSYLIDCMKTNDEIRRDNLLLLIAKYGSIANLNEALGKARNDATLSQLKNLSKDSKTGVPKAMGNSSARHIEEALKLEIGWMDHSHVSTEPAAQPALEISLSQALATLSDTLVKVDASTRRRIMANLADLEREPEGHAPVCCAIEALIAQANRQAA